MKLLSVLAAGAIAVPQRLLAPGLRDRDQNGNLKKFVSDEGYGLGSGYDFEANRNVNAKPINPIYTSTWLNILCRNSPTDELCLNGLRGVWGNFDSTTAKLYDIGKKITIIFHVSSIFMKKLSSQKIEFQSVNDIFD